jgi:hypothetical protein
MLLFGNGREKNGTSSERGATVGKNAWYSSVGYNHQFSGKRGAKEMLGRKNGKTKKQREYEKEE